MNRSRFPLAVFWLFAGAMHFIRPREYEATVPEYIPISPEDAVRWSGYAEIAGGLAVLPARTRRFGRWWLLGLLLAVFPANVHMAADPAGSPGRRRSDRPDPARAPVAATAAAAAGHALGVASHRLATLAGRGFDAPQGRG